MQGRYADSLGDFTMHEAGFVLHDERAWQLIFCFVRMGNLSFRLGECPGA